LTIDELAALVHCAHVYVYTCKKLLLMLVPCALDCATLNAAVIQRSQDMEDALRGACNSLIECATSLCAEQLTAFVTKARVFQSRSDSASTAAAASTTANSSSTSLREQQFAQVKPSSSTQIDWLVMI
jgi:hypothetical protein